MYRATAYMAENVHTCVQKSLLLAGYDDVILRKIKTMGDNTMDIRDLEDTLKSDAQVKLLDHFDIFVTFINVAEQPMSDFQVNILDRYR